jgi:putative membrane protein
MRLNLKHGAALAAAFKHGAALAAAGILIAASGAVYAQNNGNNVNAVNSSSANLSAQDRTFAREAAQADLAEIELGQLAEQKATNQSVKQFAQKIVADHQQNNNQFKEIAQKLNLTLPTTLSAKDQTLKSQLESKSGQAFDRDYVRHMVTGHEQAIKLFQRQANSGTNPELKNFASQTLPTLQEHLKMAKQTEQEVNNANGHGNR